MERRKTSLSLQVNRLGRACMAVCFLSVLSQVQPMYGGVYVEPVINPSPFIAQGHLEGGINGEGDPRPDGKTPLMLAVQAHDLQVIDYLLKHGADQESKDAAGETALDLAQRGLNQATADLLGAFTLAHPSFSEYYAGKSPVLVMGSAKSQSGSPGRPAPHSLIVRVMDHDGQPLADAPVRFVVDGGGQNLLTQASSPSSSSLVLRSNDAGECRANVKLPKEPNTRIHIIASVGIGEQQSKATFTELTNDGSSNAAFSCYDPTYIPTTMSPNGDADIIWQNNTDDETALKVWVKLPAGWKLVATLPPHSTSMHFSNR